LLVALGVWGVALLVGRGLVGTRPDVLPLETQPAVIRPTANNRPQVLRVEKGGLCEAIKSVLFSRS
jgi:hypothetical protein